MTVGKPQLIELRRTLFACIGHFRTLEDLYQVLRLEWDYPAASCLNTAEINRHATPLQRGDVFSVAITAESGVKELWVNHPSADSPAIFRVRSDGAFPIGLSDYARQVAETNLRAWADLTGVPVQSEQAKQKHRSGPRAKNDDLLAFAEAIRKKQPTLTDKEILNHFRKKHPTHSIFESQDPERSLRAARARNRRKKGG
jgi:hypothetical protein